MYIIHVKQRQYLVSWTAFSDDNIPRETTNSHTVRIHQRTIMLSNTADSEQEITLSIKHLQTNTIWATYCIVLFAYLYLS